MWLRPSTAFYGNFSLDMDRSPGFGSARADSFALFRLGFPPAPHLKCLTMPAHAARRTVLQKVRGRTLDILPQFVNTGFQVLFHSPPGVLFTFPSRYFSSIGHQSVFRVAGWSPLLPPGFLVSRCTLDPAAPLPPSPTGLSPSPAGLSRTFLLGSAVTSAVLNPGMLASRFALLPFRSPLLRKSIFLSFPRPTWMFRFRRFPSVRYGFAYGWPESFRPGFPIQIPADHGSFASPRGFSQLIASFIGPWCQGIRPVLFSA